MRTQTLRKLTLICVVALSVLFSANSVLAQEQSCDIDGVKVGFQGTVCGIGAFFVELNGVRANGVNTKCLSIVGGNFTFTSTNKAFARLKPNQTYVVTSGPGICVNHITIKKHNYQSFRVLWLICLVSFCGGVLFNNILSVKDHYFGKEG